MRPCGLRRLPSLTAEILPPATQYGALVGRTANELKIDLGLTNDD
jgi:hypothetical protein